MTLPIRSEAIADHNMAQVDAFFISMWRTPATVTIASGILTISGWGGYKVATQGGAALDELDKLVGVPAGEWVLLMLANGSQHVQVKHGTWLKLANGLDCLLDGEDDNILLRSKGSDVLMEITRSRNHA